MTCPDGNTRNQIDYASIVQRWKNKLEELSHVSTSRLRTDHRLLVATVKVRLAKRQRQHSIPPLNVDELKEEKAVQFALKAAHDEVTPDDVWEGTKTVLLEVAKETSGYVKSQKKKKWISDDMQ